MVTDSLTYPASVQATDTNDVCDRSSVLSRTFSSLKWFLALTVVADHFFRITPTTAGGVAFDTASYPGFTFICDFVSHFIKNYAVPVFFFMSGYLAYRSDILKRNDWKRILRKKTRALVIPFLAFTLFGILVLYALNLILYFKGFMQASVAFMPFIAADGSMDFSNLGSMIIGIGSDTYFPYYNVPLWYVRDLFALFLLLPAIHYAVRRLNAPCLFIILALALILLTGACFARPQVGLFFFTWGYWMRSRHIDPEKSFCRILPIVVILYPLLSTVCLFLSDTHPELTRIIHNANTILIVPFLIGIFSILVRNGILSGSGFLASASFLLYVTHLCWMWIFKDIILRTVNPADGSIAGTLSLLATYIILIITTLILYNALSVYTPRFLNLICGRY